MLKRREELEQNIKRNIKSITKNKERLYGKAEKLKHEFGVDGGAAMEIVNMAKDLAECDDNLLYKTAVVFDINNIESFFTPKEIKEYGKKYESEELTLPLSLKAIEVQEDQYIGVMSSQFLMKLRDSQLISYNENVQRKMKKVIKGEEMSYQIALNKKAISAIKKSFSCKSYIPNVITLCIPEDGEFYYDGDNLVISKLDHFDIIDGFHRYLAMSELTNLNPEFDYPMEVRVVAFSEVKAKQFIWQEDQKTQMKKMDSESFNMNSDANIVVSMLNETPLLRGMFNAGGIIDSALAGRMLQITFFRENKQYTNQMRRNIKKHIVECFEMLVEENDDVLDRIWDEEYIISFFYAIWKMQDEREHMLDVLNLVYEASKDEEYRYLFINKSFKRSDMNRLDKVMEGFLNV